ncbi:MAG: hypothetical protein AB7O52_18690, partial [Planctomycetota bacterium]
FVFQRLWATIAIDQSDASWNQMLWYLALTEWITLSIPTVHLDIEADVRSGDIAYQLPRPTSYLFARLAGGAGTVVVRLAVLGVLGFGMTYALAGGAVPAGIQLAQALLVGLGASGLALICVVGIGITALWLQDVSPIYWAWQKSVFVLGGLFVPLTLYPGWLRSVAEWTPCHVLLYGVGSRVLPSPELSTVAVIVRLAAWSALLLLLVVLLYRRAVARLDLNGG